jgi:hypothetical protein
VAANSLRGPPFSWVPIFLMAFFLCHATVAWQDTFLQATANLLPDPRFPQVFSFLFGRALRPDYGPYAASSVLQPASLWLLP